MLSRKFYGNNNSFFNIKVSLKNKTTQSTHLRKCAVQVVLKIRETKLTYCSVTSRCIYASWVLSTTTHSKYSSRFKFIV